MKKTIKQNRINVTGETDEIRELILNICQEMGRGHHRELEQDMSNLERITEFDNYTFGMHHRIYYKNDEMLYVPNASGPAAKFHFSFFKPVFDRAYQSVGKTSKELCNGCDVPSGNLQYGNNGKQYCPRCKEEVTGYGIKF